MITRAHREDETRHVSGTDDDVLRPRRAMDVVPLPQGPLLALDDQQRLTREDKKSFLIGFPVVYRHRRTGDEHAKEDAELTKLPIALEFTARRLARAMQPSRLASVQDEPPVTSRHEPGLRLFERRFGNHRQSIVLGSQRASAGTHLGPRDSTSRGERAGMSPGTALDQSLFGFQMISQRWPSRSLK
jgi:hypothetical protein